MNIIQDDFSNQHQHDEEPSPPPSTSPTIKNAPSASSSTGSHDHHHQRRVWVKPRSTEWWDCLNLPSTPDSDFRREFRMSRATFDLLCDLLSPAITKEDTALRSAVPTPLRLAVCLSRLATGLPLRTLSDRFGLGISTCHRLVLDVALAIKSNLIATFLRWPVEPSTVSNQFEAISGIPNILGVIYTMHVPIIAPKVNAASYFNRRLTERNGKPSYSISLQGVVDPSGIFTDVYIGQPGSMSEGQVFEKSGLYRREVDGWVVGGLGLPVMDWVLVPYAQRNLTWAQHVYNEKVGELREVARRAFSRLKRRWGCLQKRSEMKLEDLPVVVGACCVLHNICEMRGEEVGFEGGEDEVVVDEVVAADGVGSVSSIRARDRVAHNLLHSGCGGMGSF